MADTSVKLSGTYDSIEAYNILEQMRDMSDDFDGARDEAVAAASTATAAVSTAQGYANSASTYAGNASTYADNASDSADDAAASAANASTSEGNASTSATNAHNSELAAAASESAAAGSADDAEAAAAAAALAITPTGSVLAFAGSTSPAGWLLCDGSAVSRTTYADLYAVIGDTYGNGDGSTTFNLPDLADKFIQGNATSGTVKSAGLPNIEGTFTPSIPYNASGSTGSIASSNKTGAFSNSGSTAKLRYFTHAGLTTDELNLNVKFSASDSNAIYGNSATVQPPALTMRYIIKY